MDNLNPTEPNAPAPAAMTSYLQAAVSETNRNMRFVGIFTIIYGALACLSIIGAIVGIPIIIAGNRLREAADSFEHYVISGDAQSLQTAIEKQGRYFFIQKVFIIIGLIFIAIYLVVIIAMIAGGGYRY
jgi:hypothetical protein